jgi:TolB-like protein
MIEYSLKFKFIRIFTSLLFFSLASTGCYTIEGEERRVSRPPAPSPIEILANSLSEAGFKIRGKKIIVLTFYDRDGNRVDPRLGELISEKLTTELVKKGGFQVLDRGIYGKILKSKGLNLNGDMDLATMKKVASYLKVDGIVTGILYKYGDGVFVNTRLLDIDTGLILKAEEVFLSING